MHEFELIDKYFAPLAGEGSFGLRDDAAHLTPPPGKTLVVTADAIVEAIHYIGNETPDLIAQKLLRVNLSDLAAKAATPWGYTLSLALPSDANESWIAKFAEGLARDQKEFGLVLFGGDTTKMRTPHAASFSVTMFGLTPSGRLLLRSGAKPDDLLCMTGTLGDAALGLHVARGSFATLDPVHRTALLQRYQLPQPRFRFANALREHATACLDLSDGLAQDAGHIARQSNVAIIINRAMLPLSEAAESALALAPELALLPLHGGDDYELLCTVPPQKFSALSMAAATAGIPFHCIGKVENGNGVTVQDSKGNAIAIPNPGWRHL